MLIENLEKRGRGLDLSTTASLGDRDLIQLLSKTPQHSDQAAVPLLWLDSPVVRSILQSGYGCAEAA